MKNIFQGAGLALLGAMFLAAPVSAAVTGMTLVGGCPESEDGPLCFDAGNATEDNVAALLGVDSSLVNFVDAIDDSDPTSPAFSIDIDLSVDEENSGSYTVNDTSITHLAFKADGYYILGQVDAATGDWSTDITMWTPDVTTLTCPAGICADVDRAYTVEDFLNGGTSVADLSNVRAFNVVPIPAAVWLFGSGLGLLGWMKRRSLK